MEQITKWKESVLKNYLKKNGENSLNFADLSHIEDWMKSADAAMFINRLQRISVPQALEHAEKWTKTLNKKTSLIEDHEGLEEIYRFPNNFRMVKLSSEQAYAREGAMMGHCVKTYFTRTDSTIYSLRDENNNPHCTIELNLASSTYDARTRRSSTQKEIVQIKGKGNKPVAEKYRQMVKEFLNEANIEIDTIDSDEAQYLGEYAAGRNIFDFIKGETKEITLKGNVTWNKSLDNDRVYPDTLKIKGNFTLESIHPSKEYALFSELHVSGDLVVEDVRGIQRLALKVFVDGNVTIVDSNSLLKLGEEVYVGKDVDVQDCRELKCIGNSGLIQGNLYVVDCATFQKKQTQTIKGKFERE